MKIVMEVIFWEDIFLYPSLTIVLWLLPERMETEILEKRQANLHDIEKYAMHITFKTNTKLLKKVHRVMKSNQKAWLESYKDMNTELRKNQKWFNKRIWQTVQFKKKKKIEENVIKQKY